MSQEYDCEIDIDGKKLGDSKRKGYEGQIKARVSTPAQFTHSSGKEVVGVANSQLYIDDVHIQGVIQNMGNLRTAAGLGKNTKMKKVVITRLAKLEGQPQDQVTQTITLQNATFKELVSDDHSNQFSAVVDYEEIEIKDIQIKQDGTIGSPIVNSYNRLTNVMNA